MGIEIERKFLVKNKSWQQNADKGQVLKQGYLNTNKERTVRVRLKGEQGFLTIKGKNQGISRLEFEYLIPKEDALQLLALCEQPIIEKTRYEVLFEGLVWEIDMFEGANEGLLVAEVELESEVQHIKLPDWIGKEVSQDARYYNSNLSQQPWKKWKQ